MNYLYFCGPTLNGSLHLGHLRVFLYAEFLRRIENKKTKLIINVTDVDDKIINLINNKEEFINLINHYKNEFIYVLKKFFIKVDIIPSVIENMDFIIKIIEKLEEKNKIILKEDGVIFKSVEEKNQFYLWKKYKETDKGIGWNSKYGFGRPGWHIECASFIIKNFPNKEKDSLIHGGGSDLKFPHHFNEELILKEFNINIKKWIHVGSVLDINLKKFSKSLKNEILIKDCLIKYSYKVIILSLFYNNITTPIKINETILNETFSFFNKIKSICNFIKKEIKKITLIETSFEEDELIKNVIEDYKLKNLRIAITNTINYIKIVKNKILNNSFKISPFFIKNLKILKNISFKIFNLI